MAITRSVLLIIVAVVCFAVAFLVALGAIHGAYDVWLAGGLTAFAASFLP